MERSNCLPERVSRKSDKVSFWRNFAKAWLIKLSPAHLLYDDVHLLRKASDSNSDTFGRYEIRKVRGTFPIVILVEQAAASNIPPVIVQNQLSDYTFVHSI